MGPYFIGGSFMYIKNPPYKKKRNSYSYILNKIIILHEISFNR